jgi:hypothetical protein
MILHPVADQLIALGITAGLVLIAIIVGVCLIKARPKTDLATPSLSTVPRDSEHLGYAVLKMGGLG